MSKREPAHLSQNDQIYHFRAKVGRFWVNFGKTITLPQFRRTQISLLGSVLTTFGSKTHCSPWASVSQLIFLKNDQIYHFRAKIGHFGVNFGKTITLPEFRRTQISLLVSVLTVFDSKTHHNPKASMSQLIFLKMTKYTMSGPKLAVFGLILAKISLCLSFAAPKFHSWDLFWLFLVAKLITTHKQAWASLFVSKWPKIPFYSQNWSVLG